MAPDLDFRIVATVFEARLDVGRAVPARVVLVRDVMESPEYDWSWQVLTCEHRERVIGRGFARSRESALHQIGLWVEREKAKPTRTHTAA